MLDHDRLFKELLTTFFVEFLELFLPDLASELNRGSIVFLDKEMFTDVTSGQRHQVDLLARASFRAQQSFLLIHVENQAQQQADFARRMFDYCARLHQKFDLPIYPIAVFSHDSHRPEPATYEMRLGNWPVLRFAFRVIQLRRLPWRRFVRQPNPVAAALMARMGMRPEERPRVKLECLRLLTTLRLDRARQRLISGFIDTYLKLNPRETLQFARQADSFLSRDERVQVMELTTSWKEEGRRKGRREGETRLVLRLLRRRCGSLSPALQAQVMALSLHELERLGEALLEFASLADLKSWLRSH